MRIEKLLKIHGINVSLFLILLLATITRFWGIDFGLPQTSIKHGEWFNINTAVRFGGGDLNPHFFNYPPLYLYLLFILYLTYFVIGIMLGKFDSSIAFVRELTLEPTNFFLIGRFLSVFFGVATVWIVYHFASGVFNKRVAIVAALFTSITYVHVRESHFAKIDVAATFAILCTAWFILKIKPKASSNSYLGAGFLIGLSSATKYVSVLLLVPLIFKQLFNKTLKGPQKILISMVGLGSGFFIGDPFALQDYRNFFAGLISLWEMSRQPWYGVNLGLGITYHLTFTLWYGVGWSMLVGGLMGLLLLLKNNFRTGIVFASFPIACYLIMGSSYIVLIRNVLPIVPFLCIGAAFTINEINRLVSKLTKPLLGTFVFYLLILLVVFPNLFNSIQFNNLLTKKDNRLVAADWMHAHLAGGSSIYQVGSWLGTMQLTPSIVSLEREYNNQLVATTRDAIQHTTLGERIAYLKQTNRDGFNEWSYDETTDTFSFKEEVQTGLPDYVIRYETPLLVDKQTSPITPRIHQRIAESYFLIKTFTAFDAFNTLSQFDHQDAFHVPYVGFRHWERPGPNIFIYERK